MHVTVGMRRGLSALWVTVVLGGCGSHAMQASTKKVSSTNYSSAGVWLGEPAGPGDMRNCGDLVHGDHAALEVRVHDINCMQAAGLVEVFLDRRFAAPSGWSGGFRPAPRAPRGSPPLFKRLLGTFGLHSLQGPGEIEALVTRVPKRSSGADLGDSAPRFGCHTRSSLCPPY